MIFTPLLFSSENSGIEAGVDEAGRGCLAGPVVAAAVVFPPGFSHPLIMDSKILNPQQRLEARAAILTHAETWGMGMVSAPRIDSINILNATFEAMTEAVEALHPAPQRLAIDGNRFRSRLDIPYSCMVKGDQRYLHIAAASILAKTVRDEVMVLLDELYPGYGWRENKGYPTAAHRKAIQDLGLTPFHRRSFGPCSQLALF